MRKICWRNCLARIISVLIDTQNSTIHKFFAIITSKIFTHGPFYPQICLQRHQFRRNRASLETYKIFGLFYAKFRRTNKLTIFLR
jgi:hypothetical protein